MQVKVTPVKRTAMQYTLPQTAEACAVRAELRVKLTQALEKGRDVFSPYNTSNSQVDQKWHFGYNVYTVAKQEQEMDAYWFYDNDADEYVRVPAADELA